MPIGAVRQSAFIFNTVRMEKLFPAASFRWKIAGDFGLAKEGIADGSTGELTLEASLDRPAFFTSPATALDENGNPRSGIRRLFWRCRR